jgi:DNA-binding LytR/AlgR family response regulator
MKVYKQKEDCKLLTINLKTSKKISINNVILLKSDTNYTTFHLSQGKAKVVAHTMKYFEKVLQSHGFLRVHRSFMINPIYVKEYNSVDEVFTMTNGHIANISRRRKRNLKEFMG